MLVYTFDDPNDGNHEDLEAIGYSGDSGGPALVQQTDGSWVIAGVKSNGACCDYGSENEYTRLGDIAREWIQKNTRFDDNDRALTDVWNIP